VSTVMNLRVLQHFGKLLVYKIEINGREGSAALTTRHSSIYKKLALKFSDRWLSLSRYSRCLLGNSGVAVQLAASEVGLTCTELEFGGFRR
jgi:hypothetical protein